jgi:hypothetical protein
MVVRSVNSILVLDLIVLALCVASVYRVSERAGLPFAVADQNDSVTVAATSRSAKWPFIPRPLHKSCTLFIQTFSHGLSKNFVSWLGPIGTHQL